MAIFPRKILPSSKCFRAPFFEVSFVFQLRSSVWFLWWNTRRWTKMKWWVTLQSKRAQLLCRTQPQASLFESWEIFFEENTRFVPHLPAASKGIPNGSVWTGVNSPFKLGPLGFKDTTPSRSPGSWFLVGQVHRWRWQLQCLAQQLKVGKMANTVLIFPQVCRSVLHWLWQVRTQDVVLMVDGHDFEDISCLHQKNTTHFFFAASLVLIFWLFFESFPWMRLSITSKSCRSWIGSCESQRGRR